MFRLTLGLSVVMLAACAAEPLSGAGDPGPVQAAYAGGPGVDAGARGVDAGPRGVDAGTRGVDASARGVDAGPRGVDAGPRGVDAGAPGLDAGAPRIDAGARDARATGRDAGAADAGDGAADSATVRCVEPALDPALARFQVGMVGTWSGTATAPSSWTWTKATVEFAFDCDGHYHARCIAHDGTDPECVALYYGTDADSPEKTYAVSDVRADGKATGDIEVYFFPGDTTDDALNAIDLDATGQTLSFDLIHLGEYGPIHYALARQ